MKQFNKILIPAFMAAMALTACQPDTDHEGTGRMKNTVSVPNMSLKFVTLQTAGYLWR